MHRTESLQKAAKETKVWNLDLETFAIFASFCLIVVNQPDSRGDSDFVILQTSASSARRAEALREGGWFLL